MIVLAGALMLTPYMPSAQAQDRCATMARGCFLSEDGTHRSVTRADSLMVGRPVPDYLRAAAEMAVFLTIGTGWYWLELDRNVADWDLDSWEQRFSSEAYRYDNNEFPMNFVFHPWGGAAFYAFARGNDLGVPASSLYAFLTSFAWEFLIEFRERVSINDTLVTPLAGVPIGEFFYRLGRRLEHPALRWTLGIPVAFHEWLDEEGVDEEGGGRTLDLGGRIRLSYGASVARAHRGHEASESFAIHELSMDGTLVDLPGYLRPGTFHRSFTEANVTTLRLRGALGHGGIGLEVLADTTLLGVHHQALARVPGGLRGHATTLGTSLAFYYRSEDYELFEDHVSLLGLPGLALDLHLFGGPARFHAGTRLYGAFAGMHSHAFETWQSDSDLRAKSILVKQGYYYGWGLWSRSYASLEVEWLELGAELSYSIIDSHEGLDRTQDVVTADVDAIDSALDFSAFVRLSPLSLPVYLELAVGGQARTSEVETIRANADLSRAILRLGYTPLP